MNLIGGIGTARRNLFQWFGGLALSAKAGIATAAFVTMSAGVVIGAPYTPSSVPWLTPAVAGYDTLQTPSALNPSMVVAASATPSGASTTARGTTRPSVTATPTTQQPAGATTSAAVATSSRLATTMAPATTASTQAKTTAKATTAQTSASVYYKNCVQASKSGAAPITSGQPGYRVGLDPNHNGVACE